MAPVLARAQLRVPQTTKTAPVILESIPLQVDGDYHALKPIFL